MSHYFFDSSGIVKRYIPEQGTLWVRSLIEPNAGHTLLIASITRVEVVSAVQRRVREGSVPPRTAQAVRLLLERHSQRQYLMIGLTDRVIRHARDLLTNHPLRAYDAIQLASALESNTLLVQAGIAPLVFVTADQRLQSVALAEGMLAENPNAHP